MSDLYNQYIVRFQNALRSLDFNELDKFSSLLLSKRKNLNSIFIAGNGGSAACAEHMSIDLMFGTKAQNPSFKTVCLSSNSSSISATGNDVSFDAIFSRQIEHLGKTGDLLIVISASGNSRNLINVVDVAKSIGIDTMAIIGFDGGELIKLVDFCIHIETKIGDYGIAEDIQLMVNHLLVENIREKLSV